MRRREFIKSVSILGLTGAILPKLLIEPMVRVAPISVMPMNKELYKAMSSQRRLNRMESMIIEHARRSSGFG